ncbi:MAG: hypothetical protein M3136_05200 [Thermoproteota archaeon]|nr:hypothetical protein [Thermoproteota archaeon]
MRFARNFFTQLEDFNLKKVNHPKGNKQHQKQEERIEIPIEEVVTKLTQAHIKTTEDIYDAIWVQNVILGTVALNCIELKKDIRELARAFNTPQKKRKEKLIQIAHRFEIEEKEFQDDIKNAKQMARMTQWWHRRLDDMKKGHPDERI